MGFPFQGAGQRVSWLLRLLIHRESMLAKHGVQHALNHHMYHCNVCPSVSVTDNGDFTLGGRKRKDNTSGPGYLCIA